MTENRAETLRAARGRASEVLREYNIWRGKNNAATVCVFEGREDVAFYHSIRQRVNESAQYAAYVTLGKDRLLSLREKLKANVEAQQSRHFYFVDHDFDGLKGQTKEEDVYLTPCYSIENLLVGEEILQSLLRTKFHCYDKHAEEDIAKILSLFQARQAEFEQAISSANRWLHAARCQELLCKSITEDLDKLVRINLQRVEQEADGAKLATLLGMAAEPDQAFLQTSAAQFAQLNPLRDWRGKFWYEFFCKFLCLLKDDRCQKQPQCFHTKVSIDFNFSQDIIDTLAQHAPIPACLRDFMQKIATPAVH